MRPELVKIIECPRDAWQGMPRQIPAEVKADYLRTVFAGFQHIDAVSFVSPRRFRKWRTRSRCWPCWPRRQAEIIGIVVNEQGAERAIRTGAVSTVGFPYSISATFLERNQTADPAAARQTLEKISTRAVQAGLGVVAYLSMAFGNPYDDPWRPEDVMAACHTLKEMGITAISLADTVGLAGPEQVRSLLRAQCSASTRHRVWRTPARSPGASRGEGRGGLPGRLSTPGHGAGRSGRLSLSQDALVGNLATEAALAELKQLGAELPRLAPLDELMVMGRTIADRFGGI